MNNKICFFCVGTGGHVLPVKNLVNELKNLDVDKENIIDTLVEQQQQNR